MTAKEFDRGIRQCIEMEKAISALEDNNYEVSQNLFKEIGVGAVSINVIDGNAQIAVTKNLEKVAELLDVEDFYWEEELYRVVFPFRKCFDYDGAKFYELRETKEEEE